MKKALKPIWHKNSFNLSIPEDLRSWILHKGSFMDRLKDHGVKNPVIQVLQNKWGLPEPDERRELLLEPRNYVLVREVLISGDDKLWMYARTIIPRQTIQKYKLLANLKNRSLGSVLFNEPHLQRSPFDITRLLPRMMLYEKLQKETNTKATELWARRSIFNLRENKLLLMEVFF